MLRIVHCVPALVKGGGERAAVDLANWQVRQGNEVAMIVARFADERLLRTSLDPRVEVRYISRRGGRFATYVAGTAWLLKERHWVSSFDLIHGHMTFSAVMLTFLYLWRRMAGWMSPAIVETYHAVGMPIPNLARRAHRWMAKFRDGFVLMAEDGRWADFRSSHQGLVEIIPNGLAGSAPLLRMDSKVRSFAQRASLPAGDVPVVGNIGRLVAERRPDLLAQAMCRMGQSYSRPIHFLVVGEGPERETVSRAFADSNLAGRVHFSGIALDPAVPLSLMDLYVSLNVGPVTGLAGLEAAQKGVPVIAIQLDPEYVTGAKDWIWSDQSVDKVAAEAVRLLNDRDARRDLAKLQKRHADACFSIEAMGRAYEQLYGTLVMRRSGPS